MEGETVEQEQLRTSQDVIRDLQAKIFEGATPEQLDATSRMTADAILQHDSPMTIEETNAVAKQIRAVLHPPEGV